MEIDILRHIEPAIEKGICYGQTDIRLPAGYETMHQQIAAQLDKDYDTVFSSPLLRCRLLADKLSPAVIFSNQLLELNFGNWEMKKWDDINSEALNLWMENYITQAPPNGESLMDLVNRFHSFINQLATTRKILIVAHAGIIRCGFHIFNKIPLEKIMMEKVNFGQLYRFNIPSPVL